MDDVHLGHSVCVHLVFGSEAFGAENDREPTGRATVLGGGGVVWCGRAQALLSP